MTVENAILESLIQDARNIDQIQSYLLEVCKMNIEMKEIRDILKYLIDSGWICIVDYREDLDLEMQIECSWLELTEAGESECIKRDLMMTKEEVLDDAILEYLQNGKQYTVKQLKEVVLKYALSSLTDEELYAAFERLNVTVGHDGFLQQPPNDADF